MAVSADGSTAADRPGAEGGSDVGSRLRQRQLDRIRQITLQRRDAQVRGIAGDGQVVATVDGLGGLKSLRFAPTAVDRLPGEALDNAIVEAVASARAAAEAAWQDAVAEAGSDPPALVSEAITPPEW
jgi:DNA-binding protein YbaB